MNRVTQALTGFAIATFVIGDFTTTYVAIEYFYLTEGNPLARHVLEQYGWYGLLAGKVLAALWIGVCHRTASFVDRPYAYRTVQGIVAFYALAGTFLTIHNTHTIVQRL